MVKSEARLAQDKLRSLLVEAFDPDTQEYRVDYLCCCLDALDRLSAAIARLEALLGERVR